MLESLRELFSLDFMIYAVIAGSLIALCSALLGVSLVLKRFSMIGDGLSHVAFGTLAIATALGFSPMYFTIPVVIVAAFFLLRLKDYNKINGDSAEISYIFDSDYTGEGYCSEVVKELVSVAFNKLNIRKIYAYSKNENIASIKVLIKNGFINKDSDNKDFMYYEIERGSL